MTIQTGIERMEKSDIWYSNNAIMKMTIADFFLCKNITYRVVECILFKQQLALLEVQFNMKFSKSMSHHPHSIITIISSTFRKTPEKRQTLGKKMYFQAYFFLFLCNVLPLS